MTESTDAQTTVSKGLLTQDSGGEAMSGTSPTSPSRGSAPDDDSLFSLEPLKRWTRFALRSVRRHRLVAVLSFAIAVALGGMLLAAAPPQYQSSVTILLAGDRSLGGVEGVSSSAGRQAASIILRRDSLDSIIDEVGLLSEPEKPFFGRLRDSILPSATTGEQRAEVVRNELRTSITVANNEPSATIDIAVLWPDGQQAAAIAEAAYQQFLEERIRLEVEPLRKQLSILTSRAESASAAVNAIREEEDLDVIDGASAGSEFEGAVREEQDLLAQVRDAELALAEAEAGIEFRYALSAPAEVPDVPLTSNLTGYIATLMFGLVVMFLACMALDAPRGRIIAPWQLDEERIPVLAVLQSGERIR